jgi:hypothetical protein
VTYNTQCDYQTPVDPADDPALLIRCESMIIWSGVRADGSVHMLNVTVSLLKIVTTSLSIHGGGVSNGSLLETRREGSVLCGQEALQL